MKRFLRALAMAATGVALAGTWPGAALAQSSSYSPVVVRLDATDRGLASVGTTSTQLMPANAARHGYAVQVQSASANCFIRTGVAATADYHSLKIAAGAYYETPSLHVPTSVVNIICDTAATPVYAREW